MLKSLIKTPQRGTRTGDAATIVAAFNAREGADYAAAQAALGGMELEKVAVQNGDVVFAWKMLPAGDGDEEGALTSHDACIVLCDLVQLSSILTPRQTYLADADQDGSIATADARMLLLGITG